MSKTYWVNMIIEIVDESSLFKWTIKEEDEGAVTIQYCEWSESGKKWKEPSGEITVHGTEKAREVAARIIQMCDHIDQQDQP